MLGYYEATYSQKESNQNKNVNMDEYNFKEK